MTDPATINAFLDSLRHSDLLPAGELERINEFATGHDDAESFARTLVERNVLTPWQAKMLLGGRSRFFLGRYQLLELLGRGGMGAVFKAKQTPLGRIVAIKLMNENLINDADSVNRFKREIQAAGAVDHQNIVTAYDADAVGDVHFLVMEYVEGCDLGVVVRNRHPLPVGLACELIRQAAMGLHHAHERGMVHRDVKPSNLLVSWEAEFPVVKVLDLGLSRFTESDDPDGSLTQSGQVMGTPDYIAPEQARNTKTADARSDVYSLGGTLFALLTGRVPYEGSNTVERLTRRITEDAPSVTSFQPGISVAVADIAARALSREPGARLSTALELAKAVAPFAVIGAGDREKLFRACGLTANGRSEETESFPAEVQAGTAVVDGPDQVLDVAYQRFLDRLEVGSGVVDSVEVEQLPVVQQVQAPIIPEPESTSGSSEGLVADLEARNRRDKQRMKLIGAAVIVLLALVGSYAWWLAGNESRVVINWPEEERIDASLEVDGRERTLRATGELSFSGPIGERIIRLRREGYETIELTWTLSRGATERFTPEWIPTPDTARTNELHALTKRVDDLLAGVREMPGPSEAAVVELVDDIVDFRARNPGADQSLAAAGLLYRLPAAADLLDPANIDPYEQFAAEEMIRAVTGNRASTLRDEVVAIMGSSRMRVWYTAQEMAFAPDNQTLFAAGPNGLVYVINTRSGALINLLGPSVGRISSLELSTDGKRHQHRSAVDHLVSARHSVDRGCTRQNCYPVGRINLQGTAADAAPCSCKQPEPVGRLT